MGYGSGSYGSEAYGGNVGQKTRSIKFTLDARIGTFVNFTLDAVLLKTNSKTFTLDAVLLKTKQKTFTLDSILVFRQSKTFTLDARLIKTKLKTFTLDAVLLKTKQKTFTLDSILVFRRLKLYTIDSLLIKTQLSTFSISGRAYVTQNWYNSGWKHRKKITITPCISSITQLNTVLTLTVHKGTGIDSGTDIFVSECRNDFGDIRFTNQDGTSLLGYNITSFISGISAIIDIKIPYIPTSPDTTFFYMYYGNSSASTTGSSIQKTIYSDNFNDGTTTGWNFIHGSNGTGGMSNPGTFLQLNASSSAIDPNTDWNVIYSDFVLPNSYQYTLKFKYSDRSTIPYILFGASTLAPSSTHFRGMAINFVGGQGGTPATTINLFDDSRSIVATSPVLNTYIANTFYNLKIVVDNNITSMRVRIYEDGQTNPTIDYTDLTLNYLGGRMRFQGSDTLGSILGFDDILISGSTICATLSFGKQENLFLGRNILRTHRVGVKIFNG